MQIGTQEEKEEEEELHHSDEKLWTQKKNVKPMDKQWTQLCMWMCQIQSNKEKSPSCATTFCSKVLKSPEKSCVIQNL